MSVCPFMTEYGNITSAVSNAQQILSMASVYCYYNEIHDLDDLIRIYTDELWSASHSYSASMGDGIFLRRLVARIYPRPLPGRRQISKLEGEDHFNGEKQYQIR